MRFLKRHYEKIILCAVLLSLAVAAVWMGSIITKLKEEVDKPPEAPRNARPLAPLDLTSEQLALAQVTNPPPVVLAGDHNLFNPVTWRRKSDGELLKIARSGPDVLRISNISPLYTVISYDHPTGAGAIYVFTVQRNSGKKSVEYSKPNEKPKSGLYYIRGTKGAPDDPTEIQLEIPDTQETVEISHDKPYKRVDGYIVDMRYKPELKNLTKQHVNDVFTLDGEPYKIIEITNNLVRVQSTKNTKVTTIMLNGSP